MLNVLSADEQFLAIINRSVDNRMIFYFIVSIDYFTLNKQDTQKNHDNDDDDDDDDDDDGDDEAGR